MKVFAHGPVPHVAAVHSSLVAYKESLICPRIALTECGSSLCIQSELKVMREVEAMPQILLDLLLDRLNGGQLLC